MGVFFFMAVGCGLSEGTYFGKVSTDLDPGHLRWCNSGEPQYLDPALVSSTTGIPIVEAMFAGLTDYDKDAALESSIATRWDIAPDQRRFTFHLRSDAKFSDGTPITSADFAYHIARILHPLTGSQNAEPFHKLRNGELYNANRVRKVLHDVPPFRMGDIVELIKPPPSDSSQSSSLPETNLRKSSRPLALRDLGAEPGAAYAIVPPTEQVTLLEYSQNQTWAYVHWNQGDGVYGWVPAKELTILPNASVVYQVREVARTQIPGLDLTREQLEADRHGVRRQGTLRGKDLVMLPELLGVRTPDPYTLVLETVGPLPHMMEWTADRIFRPAPRHVVSRYPRRWTKPEHIVTSGPFHMTAWRIRDYIQLEKSKTYWDNASIRLDKITVFSIDDLEATANFYFYGGCDAANNVPSSYIPLLDGTLHNRAPFRDYTRFDRIGIYSYLVNTKKFPNVHFRRALAYATDRSHFPRILKGGQAPSYQWTPGVPVSQLTDEQRAVCKVTREHPGVALMMTPTLCYVPPQGLPFDPQKAKSELAIARKQMGKDFRTSFTIKFNTMEAHKIIAEQIQQQWKQVLGLDIELQSQEWKTYLSDTNNGEFEVARMGWVASFPNPESEFLAPLFKCSAPSNRTYFCSEKFDRLFEELERTADREKRIALTKEAEKDMIQAAPVIPMYVYKQHHLQKPYVRGLKINIADVVLFRHAWIDLAWKDRVP